MTHYIHIHSPSPTERSINWATCVDCKKRSAFAVIWFEWYGPSSTCMRCGRDYDEEWTSIRAPLERGWRQKNKDMMRSRWKQAPPRIRP